MNVEIINIGDELLIGQVVNTNATWMAAILNENGINVTQISTIADKSHAIEETLRNALANNDAVLISGGLGPTKDDITKTTLCSFFNSELIENAEALANIREIFTRRGYELSETNRKQAEVPACCTVLNNKLGTAPGMWFEEKGKIIISLPGVPSEMKALTTEQVIPMLKKHFNIKQAIIHRTLLVHGIGESFLSDKLEDFEAQLPKEISLAYLPNFGTIRLRLSGRSQNMSTLQNEIDSQAKKLFDTIQEYVIACEDISLEELVGKLLLKKNATFSISESCTGGYISHKITSVAGCSAYFKGSVVSYSNEVKERILGVKEEILKTYEAVSEQTAKEMVVGVREKLGTDYAISTTGIAGPDGGTEEKPVGRVWIGIATPNKTEAYCYNFGNNREQIIQRTCHQALVLLIKALQESESN